MEFACAGDNLFVIYDGLICPLRGGNQVVLVVPYDNVLCNDLLAKHHDSPVAGQLGFYCMTHALAKSYWW